MPAVHHETFRVRYTDCDALGCVHDLQYLRWMQEAAFGASTAVGYDLARYSSLGQVWLVRDTDIEFLRPLAYGDEVMVKTWVADFRRSHSRRRYEFFHAGSGELAARAATDWVYVDVETLRPAAVPAAMQLAFCPEGAPEAGAPRVRFPDLPPPPPKVFSARLRVEWRDIDSMWHVNNAAYLGYLEEATSRLCEARGWPMERMLAAGFSITTRRHRIEYRQPAKLGDELEAAAWFSDARQATALCHYTLRRIEDGVLLVRAHTRSVWVDLKTGRPIRIPPDFRAAFDDNLARSAAVETRLGENHESD
jgi:acyl-CoA thioester hydrolase